MRALLCIAAIAVLAVSGCAIAPPHPPASTAPEAVASIPFVSAQELIGSWIASGAPDQAGTNDLLIEAREFVLWEECGVSTGDWAGYDHTLAFGASGSRIGDCPRGSDNTIRRHWLNSVKAYAPSDNGFTLMDAAGETVAELTPSPIPHDISPFSKRFIIPPTPQEELERVFAEHAALPERATVADSIVGTWVSATDPERGDVTFDNHGNATGDDGCNSWGSEFATDDRGNLVFAGGMITLVGCIDEFEPLDVLSAVTVGMVGDELTFFDENGDVVAAAVRSSD